MGVLKSAESLRPKLNPSKRDAGAGAAETAIGAVARAAAPRAKMNPVEERRRPVSNFIV